MIFTEIIQLHEKKYAPNQDEVTKQWHVWFLMRKTGKAS